MTKGNLFDGINSLDLKEEFVEKIFEFEDKYIERIISKAHRTPAAEWLDQKLNEWVILLQGEAVLKFKDEEEFKLQKGDYVFIPKGILHRVDYTSEEPVCIWLTFFFP